VSEPKPSLPGALLSVLVDPVDHEPLWYFAERSLLYNVRTRRAYVIKNQIPVLLDSEAIEIGESEALELERSFADAIVTGQG